MAKALNLLGRIVGAATGIVTSVCWVVAIWVPTAGLTLSGVSFVVALLMALLALFATIASVRGHVIVVMLVFLASFFPVGAFLITADHWLQWVGRSDIGFLVAAFLMWVGSRSAKLAGSSTAQ
ncbi:MAG TPA: hypothetical protein VJA26_09185 [Gammaproteobacteria bacterium]|nr:hypothetical protein [Gammaproteobacteria bacterium]